MIPEELIQKYKKPDGTIDWGKLYAENMDEIFEGPEEKRKRKIIELEDLRIFKLADELSDYVWSLVIKWDWFAKKTVGEQWVRAADSIAANIAEGYGRYFFGEYAMFLYYARGSLLESKLWAEKAHKRKLVTSDQYQYMKERLDVLPKELNATIKKIKEQQKKWQR